MKLKLSMLFYVLLTLLPSFTANSSMCESANSMTKNLYTANNINKKELAEKIKQDLLFAWNGYKKYAWGHDELKPLSKSYRDWYGTSLLMTPVDAFDTMVLMGLHKEADEAKKIILDSLSFDKNISVKFFEINIRLVGGLLSSYELTHEKGFLVLAEDLANRLMPVFNSKTGMPYMYVNLKTGEVKGDVSNPAEIGSCIIELGTLSKLTGNPLYFNKAKKALEALFERRSKIGLIGSEINIETGEWVNTNSSITGGIDSYYEYLLKAWKLFGDKDCMRMWKTSEKALNKYLADNAPTGFWYGHADMNTGKRISTHFGALDAFLPAVLALGGDLKRAEALESSCYKMWNLEGVEPEQIDYSTMKITYPGYPLRPEIIESAYYLYHFTHNEKYLEMGKTFFDDIEKYCRTQCGFAELESVVSKQKNDAMESFFFAETLKYLYLLFAPGKTLDFNKVIFNTEAHPMQKQFK